MSKELPQIMNYLGKVGMGTLLTVGEWMSAAEEAGKKPKHPEEAALDRELAELAMQVKLRKKRQQIDELRASLGLNPPRRAAPPKPPLPSSLFRFLEQRPTCAPKPASPTTETTIAETTLQELRFSRAIKSAYVDDEANEPHDHDHAATETT